MRYSILVGILLLFGIGEYAFVELVPLAPERRMARFQQFPVVKQVVDLENRRLVRDAFDQDEDGIIIHATSRDTTRWTSAESLWQDYREGNLQARRKLHEIRNSAEMQAQLEEVRPKALKGSTSHKIDYWILSRALESEKDYQQAEILLRTDTSATAQWYWSIFTRPQRVSPSSVEGMTLMVRKMMEDLHHPDWPDAEYHKYSSKDSTRLVHILKEATHGESAADSVVTRLRDDYGIDLAAVIANWRNGHFENPSMP